MEVRKKSGTIERTFKKHCLPLDLIETFNIVDGPSALTALHNLNACGYLSSAILRAAFRDVIKLYSIDKTVFDKHIQFYISECSPYLKSAYILFPEFLRYSSESISKDSDVLKASRWINNGILTGDGITSIVYRCCTAIIERAARLDSKKEFVEECFLCDYGIRKHWSTALNNSNKELKRAILYDIRKVSVGTESEFDQFTDEQILKHLLQYQLDDSLNDQQEFDNEFDNDSSDLEDNIKCEDPNIDELCKDFSEHMNLSTQSGASIITMGEVIKRLSFQELEKTDYGFVINKMPRNSIKKFYRFMEKLIKEESQFDDAEHFKRLLIIQLATHSKKIIDICRSQLDSFAKRLQPENYIEVNNFFWTHFKHSPTLFRPYAVSSALTVLCSSTRMNLVDVSTNLCQLASLDNKIASLDDNYDIILNVVLNKNYGDDIDFRPIYSLLLKYSRFNWYKTWISVFESIFKPVPCPMPLSYFKFRDIELLDDSLNQLDVILDNKMPMMNYAARLQFSLLLLERIHFIGPIGFDQDDWAIRKAREVVNKLKMVNLKCPLYLFKKRIETVCSRFEFVTTRC